MWGSCVSFFFFFFFLYEAAHDRWGHISFSLVWGHISFLFLFFTQMWWYVLHRLRLVWGHVRTHTAHCCVSPFFYKDVRILNKPEITSVTSLCSLFFPHTDVLRFSVPLLKHVRVSLYWHGVSLFLRVHTFSESTFFFSSSTQRVSTQPHEKVCIHELEFTVPLSLCSH